jgi:hypothetical protein
VIALMEKEHLRFVGKSTERRGVHDTVTIALEHGAHGARGLLMEAAGTLPRLRCIGSERSRQGLIHAPCLDGPICAYLIGRHA